MAPSSRPTIDRGTGARPAGPRLVAVMQAWPPPVQDGLLAAVVAALSMLALATVEPTDALFEPGGRPVDAGAYLIAVLTAVPLLGRRRAPVVALVVTVAGLLVFAVVGYRGVFTGYAVLAAVYSVVVYRGLVTGLLGAAGALGAVLVTYAVSPLRLEVAQFGFDLLIVATAVALGDGTRNRIAAAREHEARLATLADEQARRARQAVADERTRIARELHDLVAHAMSVVAVQAGVGHHLIDRDPARAKEALATIEATSRQALTEMRRMLGVLRTVDDEGPGRDLTPQPGLDDLEPLVRPARDAGIDVEVRREGPTRALPSGVALSAYRIVQEALTNVVKHAGPCRVEVALRYQPDALSVEVVDDGRGPAATPPTATGYGLVGMQERATVVGGEVTAGPRPGGGYRVAARLPYQHDPEP